MDDQAFAAPPPAREYRCPGQAYTIDRSVHLARLAAFYPGCLGCEHRDDTNGLSPLQLRDRAAVERRAPRGARLGSEDYAGTAGVDIDVGVVSRVASALAADLWRKRDPGAPAPTVLVGTDGSWTSADFVPAACGALQSAGCRALETGAVTSPCLAIAAHQLRADAALWVGNARGGPRASSIKLWHEAGRPASSPGVLDEVFAAYGLPAVRPKRGGGGLERSDAAGRYLPTLAELFHGLRPLTLVLDTTCEPLVRYWHALNALSACRLVRPRGGLVQAEPADVVAVAQSLPVAGGSPSVAARDEGGVNGCARRRELIAHSVLAEGAHFGAWIDGDGEACRLIDERGEAVDAERFFLALCGYACEKRPGATIVLEPTASAELARTIEHLGARVERSESTRQAMCERMESTGAVLGGGTSGRYWYSGPPAASDALLSLSLLISLLSQSDRPLSEVLDGVPAAG